MESPGMCRNLIRELTTFDLVKTSLKRSAHCCSRQIDICDNERMITAGLDSLFVQITDICHADARGDADAVIAAAQVLPFPSTVV